MKTLTFQEGTGDGGTLEASSQFGLDNQTYLQLALETIRDGEMDCRHEFWLTREDALRLGQALIDFPGP